MQKKILLRHSRSGFKRRAPTQSNGDSNRRLSTSQIPHFASHVSIHAIASPDARACAHHYHSPRAASVLPLVFHLRWTG
jgi:hypothetical protein